MKNFVDKETLLIERPNLKIECNIQTDEGIENYMILYNTYNTLLIQFLIKKFYLLNVDKELEKKKDIFPEVPDENKDLYQLSASRYLKYFYLRNNIYIERLSQDDINYLYQIYKNNDFILNDEKKQFIDKTYLNIILDNPNSNNISINYGPDNSKYIRPSNAIIIGVRYNQFSKLPNNDSVYNTYANAESQLQVLTNFLEYKIKRDYNIPFYVIQYDEFSTKKNKNIH